MAEFLLELFSEEIPARMQVKAADDLKDLIAENLIQKDITFKKIEAHSTPRRIAVVVDGLPTQQPDTIIEKRGPKIDAPEQAIQGFLKSVNLTTLEDCVKEETPKGTFWFYRKSVQGIPVAEALRDVVYDSIVDLRWPKSMKWKNYNFSWVRPLHSIIAIFDGKPLRGNFNIIMIGDAKSSALRPEVLARTDKFELAYSNETTGHRFLSSGKIEVSNFADYREKLKKAHVLLSREERKDIISKQSQELANKAGLKIREDEALFEEIVGLVEWPVPLVGEFEKEYLDVPQEVLISTMRGNQKYIALLDAAGKLSNKFIVVANMITEDGGKQVVAGNEKVLRARLSDAKFFWDQDRRQKLETRLPALEQITFHQKLGTVRDRVSRLHSLAQEIAELLGYDGKAAARAAELCKADLTSGVVYQFPEVQGTMGRYYALHDKEKPEVAQAIAEHYKPVGANDTCPTAPVSIAVALADKLDALVGFFAIDEKPTGSKDPFALRRAALGVIRIILENKLRVSLTMLFQKSYQLYGGKIKGLRPEADVTKDLTQFFTERLKVALKDQGVRHDLIDAVFAAKSDDDLTRVVARVNAVQDFVKTEDGTNLLAGYKRATNILRIEEKKDGKSYSGKDVKEALLAEEQEKNLFTALNASGGKIKADLAKEDYKAVMSGMSGIRSAVDAFFDKILVNAPDASLRANRLSMLASIAGTMNEVADFSKLEG